MLQLSGRDRRGLSELRGSSAKDTQKYNLGAYTNRRHLNVSILLILLFFLKEHLQEIPFTLGTAK